MVAAPALPPAIHARISQLHALLTRTLPSTNHRPTTSSVPAAAAAANPAAAAAQQEQFNANLAALRGFVAEKHCLPKPKDEHLGVAVGKWANQMRRQHANGKLGPKRVAALQEVPGFTWELQQQR